MKKCLVLDLDNTLWGGVLGEDGPRGVKLGLNGEGANFLAFQQAILDLWNRGVILAINSRNNYGEALEVIRSHPYMALREKHFSAMRINWKNKAENIRSLAEELNIGIDALVFLDDDPINREFVRRALPDLEVPDLPEDPGEYAKFVMDLQDLASEAITDEDKMRGNLYVTERLRMEAQKRKTSKEEFLKSLGIEVVWHENNPACISRLAQMTSRTNQFNINKKQMTEEDILIHVTDPTCSVFHICARDRFGDYGVIGLALAKKEHDNDHLFVQAFLVSCRALYRGIEEALFHLLVLKAREAGRSTIVFDLKISDKNKPARNFLEKYCDSDNKYLLENGNIVLPEWVTLKKA